MGKRATTYGVSLGLLISLWVIARSTVHWLQMHLAELGVSSFEYPATFPLSTLLALTSSRKTVLITLHVLDQAHSLLEVAPWYLLVSLGCYCLYRLGTDLLAFNSCPHEIKALENDISAARKDLAKRGMKLD